jgi:hypothetical protein
MEHILKFLACRSEPVPQEMKARSLLTAHDDCTTLMFTCIDHTIESPGSVWGHLRKTCRLDESVLDQVGEGGGSSETGDTRTVCAGDGGSGMSPGTGGQGRVARKLLILEGLGASALLKPGSFG